MTTYILNEDGDQVEVTVGQNFIVTGQLGPEDFDGFWSRGVDLPDWLNGPLLGTIQKLRIDDAGCVTYMDVGLARECCSDGEFPSTNENDTKFGCELTTLDQLAEFIDHLNWSE